MLENYSKNSLFLTVFSLTLLLVLSSLGCQTAPTAGPAEPAVTSAPEPAPAPAALPADKKGIEKPGSSPSSPISAADLENITYHSVTGQKGTVKLKWGMFSRKTSGKSATETITALSNNIAYGKLPGKRDGAAAVLITVAGGMNSFHDLAVVAKTGGKLQNIATLYLGDRIRIKSVTIDGGYIVVDMIRHGKKDSICCPTHEVVQKYEIKGNKLSLVQSRQN